MKPQIKLGILILLVSAVIACQSKNKTTQEPNKEEQSPQTEILSSKIQYYVCYTNNDNVNNRFWIAFNEQEKAVQIKYFGQNETMDLVYNKEEYIEGGTHPTISKYYHEMYKGKINGSYKVTNSGNWSYVKYHRGKDNKEFNFTIDHNANPYGKKPCF